MSNISKREFIQRFNSDEYDILSNIYDKILLCTNKGILTRGEYFYPSNIWMTLEEMSNNIGVRVISYGVFDEAERRMIAFSNDFEISENECFSSYINVINIKNKSKFKNLLHRDYLGAVMSLGIKREVIGDLLCDENSCMFPIISKINDYVLGNLSSVSNCPCDVNILEGTYNILEYKFKEYLVNVSSMRIDCIVSSICNISRSDTLDNIKSGKVLVNYCECKEKDKIIKLGAIVTVRGHGKFKLLEEVGLTNSKKIKLRINKYI